ncbi:MAG: (d)CMP kinase [Halobacteriovoraceae bacterium]|jgi:CMP/dCMP kinase|nr:(d)CMP kinase [Halobacteriovoraceae bacterium]
MKNKSKVIAIDGPSGSGKSTIAKILADSLEFVYLDTGSMYRAIGYYLNTKSINLSDVSAVEVALAQMNFQYASSQNVLVEINGDDLTHKIREHHVSGLASKVSQLACVREYLKKVQRTIALARPSIIEGRDIGTVIFPDAALKFYLVADAKIRAQRRYDQLLEKNSELKITLESILNDITLRDESDMNRTIAPLVQAEDAISIDSTKISISDVVAMITKYYLESKELFL